MNRRYTLTMLAGIRDLYRDKLLSLGVYSFKIKNKPDHTGVVITLTKPFQRGTRWDLIYGVPADIKVKSKPAKDEIHR